MREYKEQAYRNAYAAGFNGCLDILEQLAHNGENLSPSRAVVEFFYDMLVEYYRTPLNTWRIGNIDTDILPPDFFAQQGESHE